MPRHTHRVVCMHDTLAEDRFVRGSVHQGPVRQRICSPEDRFARGPVRQGPVRQRPVRQTRFDRPGSTDPVRQT
eukprot:4680585-Pyramimonas_sp.AAC.1